MRIVINHSDTVNFSHSGEAAIDALKTPQAIADGLRTHAQMQGHGHRRQSIGNIMIARHRQSTLGNHAAIAQRHVKTGRALGIGKIDCAHISLRVESIGYDPAIGNSSDQSLHFGVICVADRQTVKWDIVHKFEEPSA